MAESGRVTENVRATESGRSGSLLGGGSGSVTYQVKTVQENFHAEDGTVLYQLQLSWPYFAGKAGGVLQVNRFFEDWKNEKLRIYEADGDSIRQAALEIYRESKDSGWTGSWTERYRVSRVCTKGQYLSLIHISIGLVIPELNGKLIGSAQRVPTPTGSTTILTAVVKGNPTKEAINDAMKAASNESFGYNTDEIVSSDIVGMRYGSLFDATQTMVLPINDELSEVQVVSWYDNENSYTSQMVRTIKPVSYTHLPSV